MNKITVKSWATNHHIDNILSALNLEDGIDIFYMSHERVFKLIREMFEEGLNVMIAHEDGGDVVIYVDVKRFSQR